RQRLRDKRTQSEVDNRSLGGCQNADRVCANLSDRSAPFCPNVSIGANRPRTGRSFRRENVASAATAQYVPYGELGLGGSYCVSFSASDCAGARCVLLRALTALSPAPPLRALPLS